MPKLKCPSEAALNASVLSLWRNVESKYIETHREASKWSNLSIEATGNYKRDCRKRALPVLKWVKYECQHRNVWFDYKEVHMVDHSTTPWTACPFFVFTFALNGKEWLKIEVTIYAPKSFDDVRDKVNEALNALACVEM